MVRKTKEEFLKLAVLKHQNKYGYDKVIFIDMQTKVKIYCKACKKYFQQTPANHVKGQGCSTCGKAKASNTKRITLEEFIAKAIKVHGELYLYDRVVYKGIFDKVEIYCKKCKDYFWQTAKSHLDGGGCVVCGIAKRANSRRKTKEQFVIESVSLHGDKYNYDRVVYKGVFDKVEIYCKKCKDYFWQSPHDHLKSLGCPKCGRASGHNSRRKTLDKFIEDANKKHGIGTYDYSEVIYINNTTKVKIKCNNCGSIFEQSPCHHLRGHGCPCCVNKTESILHKWLSENYKVQHQVRFENLPGAIFDFYIEELDLIIELDGSQHFRQISNWKCPEEQQKRDKRKMQFCIDTNTNMIRLLQTDVLKNVYDWQMKLKKYIRKYDKPIIKMLEHPNSKDSYGVFSEFYKYDPDVDLVIEMPVEMLVEEKEDLWSELERSLLAEPIIDIWSELEKHLLIEPIIDIWKELENHLLEDEQVKPPILKPREDNLEP